jgi:hypothetical protein
MISNEFQNEMVDYTHITTYSDDEMNIMKDIINIIDNTGEDEYFECLTRKPINDDLKFIRIVLNKNSEFYT